MKEPSSLLENSIEKIQNKEKKRKVLLVQAYSAALILGVSSSLISVFLAPFIGAQVIYLLAVPVSAISAWYGGKYAGFLTATLTTLFTAYLFHNFHIALFPVVSVSYILFACLLLEGIGMSYLIHQARQSIELSEIKNQNSELTNVIMQLLLKIESAEKEIRARDEFLSIATHELKTPLTSMLLQLQTVLHNIRNVSLANFSVEKLLKMIESTEQQSTRLAKMINDLLNVSLITTGRLELEVEEFDLSALVREVVDRFSEKMKKENYEISVRANDVIIGTWDKVRIEQVITNLITNAIKYGDNKPIKISVSKNHATATILVEDEGIGIHPDKLSQVFGRFQRATTSHNYQGLGVGLYITHQIITAHGGKIKVESTLGSGSTFTITLPLKPKPNSN